MLYYPPNILKGSVYMSWDRDIGLFGNLILNAIEATEKIVLAPFEAAIDICEKAEVAFASDDEIDEMGKRRGYEKAAEEYEKKFVSLKADYQSAKRLFSEQRNTYNTQADILICKLETLEVKKSQLEAEFRRKSQSVSSKYNIPVGTLCISSRRNPIFDLVCNAKQNRLRNAEYWGYVEACELYERKINQLKAELKNLTNVGNEDIRKLKSLISDVLAEISSLQLKIAELETLMR